MSNVGVQTVINQVCDGYFATVACLLNQCSPVEIQTVKHPVEWVVRLVHGFFRNVLVLVVLIPLVLLWLLVLVLIVLAISIRVLPLASRSNTHLVLKADDPLQKRK